MATSDVPAGLPLRRGVTGRAATRAAATRTGRESYAGLVTRTIALAIDAAVINGAALTVAGIVALVLSIFPVSQDMREVLTVAGGVLWSAWLIGYFVTFWTTTGATLGAHVMRIRVVRLDATKLRNRHALLRFAGLVIGLPLFVGYVPILLNERRRGLQDVMGGTVVVTISDDDGDVPPRGGRVVSRRSAGAAPPGPAAGTEPAALHRQERW